MTVQQIKQFIQGGEWQSIAVELRPTKDRTGSGKIVPFYVSRGFVFSEVDKFECRVINFADPAGAVPLVKIVIKGTLQWRGDHPVAPDAQMVDYIANEAYLVTPLHPGFADSINQAPAKGLNKWEVNVTQDVKGKEFAPFGLTEGQIYIDYDLIFLCNDLLFMGSKHVDGRPFDKLENRPTNLQIPLIRKN